MQASDTTRRVEAAERAADRRRLALLLTCPLY
jgi:hypothetical protein